MTVLGLTLGPLLATAGYGLYLRSGLYANAVARGVSSFLGAPVKIGSVVPLDATSQGFHDVVVWMPGISVPVFSCDLAVLRMINGRALELDLRRGRIEVSADDWNRSNIAAFLHMTLAHDFRKARLAAIKLSDMDIVLRRGTAVLLAQGATGHVDVSEQAGRIDILCESLNNQTAAEPIALRCRFESGNLPLVRELSLLVRRLPIDAFLPGTMKTPRASQPSQPHPPLGWFTGGVTYRQKDPHNLAGLVELTGDLTELDLALLTGRLGRKGFSGTVSGTLEKAIVDDGRLQSLQARLRIVHLDLESLLSLAGFPNTHGRASLNLHEFRYEDGAIKALLADAQVHGLNIEPMLLAWCGGSITGHLSAELQKIRLVDGRLDEVAGLVKMTPPPDQLSGTVDQQVLNAAVRHVLGISLPPVLPEKIGYTDLGARFHGADNELYIEGIAGPEEKFLLVADVSPGGMPLLPQPPGPIPLDSLQSVLVSHLRPLLPALCQWLHLDHPRHLLAVPGAGANHEQQ